MGSRAITGRDPNGLDGCSTRAIDGRVTSDLDEEDTINIDVEPNMSKEAIDDKSSWVKLKNGPF